MKSISRTGILPQILEAANAEDGATQIEIMYRAFLSYTYARDFLATLVENGLLDYDRLIRKYKTTKTGLKFLNICYRLGERTKIHSQADFRWQLSGFS